MSDDKKQAAEATETQREETEALADEATLDFADLDLSVEAVDERISPSETNVFDK